jgi:hypothetical protein
MAGDPMPGGADSSGNARVSGGGASCAPGAAVDPVAFAARSARGPACRARRGAPPQAAAFANPGSGLFGGAPRYLNTRGPR